jgi:hypothetical protein
VVWCGCVGGLRRTLVDLASTWCLLVGTLPGGNPRIPGTPCQIPPPGGSGVYKTPPYPSTAGVAHRQLRTNYNASSKSKNQRIQSRRRTQDEPWRLVAASTNFDTSTMQPHASMEHRGPWGGGGTWGWGGPLGPFSRPRAPVRPLGATMRASCAVRPCVRRAPRGPVRPCVRRAPRGSVRAFTPVHRVAWVRCGAPLDLLGAMPMEAWGGIFFCGLGTLGGGDPDAPWRRVVALWTCRNLLMRLQGATVHPESEGDLSS